MAAVDRNFDANSVIAPCNYGGAITPNNSADLAIVANVLIADVDCDVKITTAGGNTFVIALQENVPFSVFRIARVWLTGGSDLSGVTILAGWQN